jgi:hypothetical protein
MQAIAEGTLDLPPPPQIASEVMRLTRGDAVHGEAGDQPVPPSSRGSSSATSRSPAR